MREGAKRSERAGAVTAVTPVPLAQLNNQIVTCTRCPRLVSYCRRIAREKRASFRDQVYWGRPVPNMLPTHPERAGLLIVGLAPAAHGANRTGRMFTGDRSGDFLYRGLYEAGFANQPTSRAADDGLELRDAVITAAGHCAPPDNKPTPAELAACRPFLSATIDAMPALRVILVLGGLAHAAVLREAKHRDWLPPGPLPRFGHGARFTLRNGIHLVCCYHPSQQNTFTGRLTPQMLTGVLHETRALLDGEL